MDLNTSKQDTFKFVTDYLFAKEGKCLAFITTGLDSTVNAGVYVLNLDNNKLSPVFEAEKAKYFELNFSDSGKNLGFVADLDTTKVQVRPNELFLWTEGESKAQKLLDPASAPKGYRVSSDGDIYFSKDETKLYFGLAKPPIVKDTTLLDEEIVNVEVWTYNEPRLYTVQELQVKNDTKKSYVSAIHLANNKLVQFIGIGEFFNNQIIIDYEDDYNKILDNVEFFRRYPCIDGYIGSLGKDKNNKIYMSLNNLIIQKGDFSDIEGSYVDYTYSIRDKYIYSVVEKPEGW